MKIILFLFSAFLFGITTAQDRGQISNIPTGSEKVVVLQPTGEMKNDLPVMIVLSDTTQLYRDVDQLFNNSFIKESVELYFLAANYLKNNNELRYIEPAYLALSRYAGG